MSNKSVITQSKTPAPIKSGPTIMEELLASRYARSKLLVLRRGQEVEGEILSITDQEITLDLGAKSEGVMATRELTSAMKSQLKPGSKLKAYVYMTENESGQTILSISPAVHSEGFGRESGRGARRGKSADWSKFLQAQNRKSKLQGQVLEINKGGLIVEVSGVRGFLPNSQVGFELMQKAGAGMEKLIGENLTVSVIEMDQNNNKLIFSQRGPVAPEVLSKLKSFKAGQTTQGKIVAVLPFGLVVDVEGAEGLVFISDVSWERVDDLPQIFTTGQELEVKVLGEDAELGRLNLSVKELTEDPFAKSAEKFPADEVVKGEIAGVSEAGVAVKLEGAEGFLPAAKVTPEADYQPGQIKTFLVDSVDTHKRRINLSPFITSTAGLIYK